MKEQPFNQKCVSKLLTGSALQVLAALMQTLKEEIYIVQNRPQPRRTGGRENHFSFMHREREEEECFDLVSNWPLTSPCP